MGKEASPERVVQDIRRKTRRRFSAEEKIRIVLEGLRGEESIATLCRKEGLAPNLYGSPKVRVGHIARLSRGGCSSMLVQQSMIMPMSAAAEWKPKARRVITRTLLCSPSTMPLVTPQRI